MKQDIILLIIIIALLIKHSPKWYTYTGIVFLLLSIPLFQFWVFFTAQRLVMYAALCFLVAITLIVLKSKKS